MTLWQFYTLFAVIVALGLGFCYVMYMLGKRNPKLGWKPGKIQEKLMWWSFLGLIFCAGICSYGEIDRITNAFSSDAAELIYNTAEDAISGKEVLPDTQEIEATLSNDWWGLRNESQKTTLYLFTGFFMFFGWCCYLGSFIASPVGIGKRLLKIVGYSALTFGYILTPSLRSLNPSSSEAGQMYIWLIIAAVCIVLSHTRTATPPPLPGAKTQPTIDTDDSSEPHYS
jgi:hypothetical protein